MTNPTSKLIAETLALGEMASPGPWVFKNTSKPDWNSYEVCGPERFDDNGNDFNFSFRSDHGGDARFIAHSRTAAPKLAEMLQVACEALQGYADADDDDVESAPITKAAREALAKMNRIASGQAAGERKEE